MSTDGHAFLEYRERGRDDWRLLASDIKVDADYLLFAVLAKVRLSSFPDAVILSIGAHCFTPKGLPESWIDVLSRPGTLDSPHVAWVRAWYENQGDGHSHTWLTYEEMGRAAQVYMLGQLHDNEYADALIVGPARSIVNSDLEAWLRYAGVYVSHGCSVRLVMWFDN